MIQNWVDDENFQSCWNTFPAYFTYTNVDYKSFSTLDHFILSEDLLINSTTSNHYPDFVSSHSPITLSVTVGYVCFIEHTPSNQYLKPHLKKTANNIEVLTKKVAQSSLHSIIPEVVGCTNDVHLKHLDSYTLDLLSMLIEFSHYTIPFPAKVDYSKRRRRNLPGWSDTVAPLRAESIKYHNIWIYQGRPNTGDCYQQMITSRKLHHKASRKCISDYRLIRAERILAASLVSDQKFLSEIRIFKSDKT